MAKPDWRSAEDYKFTEKLRPYQWAWEFLRRCPEYHKDWMEFWSHWQALVADYPEGPAKSPAWYKDPRSYICTPPRNPGESKSAWIERGMAIGECDESIIEHYYAKKWHLLVPWDPSDDLPARAWKSTGHPVILFAIPEDYGLDTAKMALGFDRSMPIEPQIERARKMLQSPRHRLKLPRNRPAMNGDPAWMTYLRVLDASDERVKQAAIAEVLFPTLPTAYPEREGQKEVQRVKQKALKMARQDYRDLLAR